MAAKESWITSAILLWLNEQPDTVAVKLHISGYSRAGDPDIFGCYRGRMFLFEVKRPGEQPTPLQWHRMSQWVSAGAAVAVVHSRGDVAELWAGRLWLPGAGILVGDT